MHARDISTKKKIQQKWRTLSERARQDIFSSIGCLSKFLSEHNVKLGESYMGKTPLFEVLTDTEYTFVLRSDL